MTDSPAAIEVSEHSTRLAGLAQVFQLLGTDCKKNIDILAEQTCILLEGSCSLYNQIDEHSQSLNVRAGHNLPQGLDRQFSPEGHICWEATIKGKNKPVVIEDLEKTEFFTTDPFVKKYNLKSYLGFPVKCRDRVIGSLCVVDLDTRIFTPDDIHCIQTLAAVLSMEEEKRLLEQDLKSARKMEAIGFMAGSVAHDLNNILAGLVSYPELLLLQLEEDSPLIEPVRFMLESGINAADIVQDMLTLTRRTVTLENLISMNTVINEHLAGAAHHHLVSKYPGILFNIRLDTDLPFFQGSETHIKRTVMNLVLNGAENVGDTGTIGIETFSAQVESPLNGYETIPAGEYVVLKVTDSGSDIPDELIPRIFEPFYTKKKMGRSGSGLSLYVVWNSVKDHNGYIEAKNNPGKGMTFELYFPAGISSPQSISPGEKSDQIYTASIPCQ